METPPAEDIEKQLIRVNLGSSPARLEKATIVTSQHGELQTALRRPIPVERGSASQTPTALVKTTYPNDEWDKARESVTSAAVTLVILMRLTGK
ncbi:hypothetical protein L914_20224 [Phytophthora nicotianae]|uniref:Uncharacterized protein n=1 Tax=Phytophthora nicotianae TaxID=4792 RepID=W2M7K7_PHYNI|nr:hypothetical protein L914_20224 [Phytophthora nicotianae]